MTTAPRPKIKNVIGPRRWETVKTAWLDSPQAFQSPGAKPEPGLDDLVPLHQVPLPPSRQRFPDVPGLRTNLLSEAVFLFHKCAHTHLAAQRLGIIGMHSWCMFNAYHAAYLGARGIMALLGVGLTIIPNGGQLLLDVFPQPESAKGKRKLAIGSFKFEEFLLVRFGKHFEQRELWEAFQRVLRVSEVSCWNERAYKELLGVPHESIAGPRNAFLYKAPFWPGSDLLADGSKDALIALLGTSLDTEMEGFLLRMSCNVYRLFEQLLDDLAEQSGPLRAQLDESRIILNPNVPDLLPYNTFLASMGQPGTSQ